jgi:hypothetical protein
MLVLGECYVIISRRYDLLLYKNGDHAMIIEAIGMKVAKNMWDRRSNNVHDDHESKKRLGRTPKILGSIALIGATLAGGALGVQRAMDRNQLITQDTVAQGGDAEIISFNADYEAHCWTSTTLQVTGAGIKDEMKALGVSTGWQEFKIDTQIENNLCIDGTALAFEVNTQTGHVNIDVPNKDSIKTQTEVVLGTIKPHQDQTVGYMFADNVTSFLESVPFIEDTGLSKDLSIAQDKRTSAKTNTSLILAAKMADDKCNDETWKLAAKPFENGIKRMAGIGMQIAKAMNLEIDPNNVSVTVEGKPMSELKVAGNTTNIDDAYNSIKKFDDGSENFSILQPASGACEVSDEVKNIPSETEPVVKLAKAESHE